MGVIVAVVGVIVVVRVVVVAPVVVAVSLLLLALRIFTLNFFLFNNFSTQYHFVAVCKIKLTYNDHVYNEFKNIRVGLK